METIEAHFKYHKDNITLNIKKTDTVKDIREKLSYELGQLPKAVHLEFNDDLLEDEEILQNALSKVPDCKEPIIIHCDDDLSSDSDDANLAVDTSKFELNPQSEFEIPSFTPDNFDENVTKLMDATKQPKEKCQHALRLAFFNPDRAAEYLISGDELPERPTLLPFANSSGLQYNPIPDKSQSPILKDFTDAEIKDLQDIMNETQANYSTAVQVFMACDKKKDPTMALLKSMD